MDAFFNSVISGLIIGSLYAIMAIGLTIVYGVSHVFNFAHGHVGVTGGYLTWLLMVSWSLGLGIGIGATLLLMALFGWFFYQMSIRYLLRRPEWEFATIVFTLGLAILFEYGLQEIFGPRIKSVPVFFEGSVRLWFGRVNLNDISLIVISILILVGLAIFLKRTTVGSAMRAVAQSVPGARVVGIDTDRIFGYTFALAFVMTGLSGILLGTKTFLTPHIGWEWMIKGFIIVTFGGLGSVFGAVLAAFTLGTTEALVTLYAGDLWIWPAWLLTFLLALWARPQGILGGKA